MNQLTLNKGGERFIFRYEEGTEDKLMDAIIDQAESHKTSFDWLDAAILCYGIAQSLIDQANALLN